MGEGMNKKDNKKLTEGSILGSLLRFSLPYLLSCFLQTFYGLADLFIAGQFNGSDTITAVSVGSQVMHMMTVIIVGLTMGTTVHIARGVGSGETKRISETIGNTITLFLFLSLVCMVLLPALRGGIVAAVSTPVEAVSQTSDYLLVCFCGIPLIIAYNVISSIYRGLGDSRTPMYFVAIAGVINIVLDALFMGPLQKGAIGAGLATVIAQGISVLLATLTMIRHNPGFLLSVRDLIPKAGVVGDLLRVGVPVAVQDGFIQISFLVITAIANARGVQVAAAVGIVEKIICFVFLVPSAMLSAVSAIAAQNAGAGKHDRGRQVLGYGVVISVGFGLVVALFCQLPVAERLVGLFAKQEPEVIMLGTQYLKSYIFDCALAGVHFCFSGYFCAYGRSGLSFIHNLLSVLLIRIPGAYLASIRYPDTLYPMGFAPPAGSLLSAALCVLFFVILYRRGSLYRTGNSLED